MPEVGVSQIAQVTYEATVLRAVPCYRHSVYTRGCRFCLTGEEAAQLGVPQRVEELGVIASSRERLPFAQFATELSVTVHRRLRRLLNRIGVS